MRRFVAAAFSLAAAIAPVCGVAATQSATGHGIKAEMRFRQLPMPIGLNRATFVLQTLGPRRSASEPITLDVRIPNQSLSVLRGTAETGPLIEGRFLSCGNRCTPDYSFFMVYPPSIMRMQSGYLITSSLVRPDPELMKGGSYRVLRRYPLDTARYREWMGAANSRDSAIQYDLVELVGPCGMIDSERVVIARNERDPYPTWMQAYISRDHSSWQLFPTKVPPSPKPSECSD